MACVVLWPASLVLGTLGGMVTPPMLLSHNFQRSLCFVRVWQVLGTLGGMVTPPTLLSYHFQRPWRPCLWSPFAFWLSAQGILPRQRTTRCLSEGRRWDRRLPFTFLPLGRRLNKSGAGGSIPAGAIHRFSRDP